MPNEELEIRPDLAPGVWLRGVYESRKLRNRFYSQRAFAKQVGLPSGRLSELLSGRRRLTRRQVETLSERLSLSLPQKKALLEQVKQLKEIALKEKTVRILASRNSDKDDYTLVNEDSFTVFADWYHLAILNLMKTKGFKSEPRWIADRLGLGTKQVSEALERLERARLARKNKGKWIRLAPSLKTTTEIPSAAIRLHHKQQLGLAANALENVPLALRDLTCMTVAVDIEKIGKAKEMIKNFRRALAATLEKDKPTEVYHLLISLCPLSQTVVEKESLL